MTVAQVRVHSDQAEVMFYESARIYRLLRANRNYDDALLVLRRSQAAGAKVTVEFEDENSDVIANVSEQKPKRN